MTVKDKKLKRGLSDLSPLFREGPIEKPVNQDNSAAKETPKAVQLMTVTSAVGFDDGMLWNSFFASRFLEIGQASMILSARNYIEWEKRPLDDSGICDDNDIRTEKLGGSLSCYTMTWEQFYKGCRMSGQLPAPSKFSTPFIFLDFCPSKTPRPEKVAALLDKWIFVVQPELHSLQETYKMMKAAALFNPHLEFYMVFDGDVSDVRGEKIYEALSHMASRRLHVDIAWLGRLNFKPKGKSVAGDLILDYLTAEPSSRCESLEKQALLRYLEMTREERLGVAV